MPGALIVPPEHQFHIHNCWGSTEKGPCKGKVDTKGREEESGCGEWQYIPYCKSCLKNGDPSVKVIPHPTLPMIGNILVATRDLPKGYRFVYWGTRLTGKAAQKRMAEDDRIIDFMYGRKCCGSIEPGPHKGSVLQMAGNPGPNEYYNMVCTTEHFGKMDDNLVGGMYHLIHDVPKGHQIAHEYGKQWFKDRKITPLNIGTPEYPMIPKLSKRHIWQTQAGRYAAMAVLDGVAQHIGLYETEREAISAQASIEAVFASQPKKGKGASPKAASPKAKKRPAASEEKVKRARASPAA